MRYDCSTSLSGTSPAYMYNRQPPEFYLNTHIACKKCYKAVVASCEYFLCRDANPTSRAGELAVNSAHEVKTDVQKHVMYIPIPAKNIYYLLLCIPGVLI